MTIDTAKLREVAKQSRSPRGDVFSQNFFADQILELCDELDLARADVLKLRSELSVPQLRGPGSVHRVSGGHPDRPGGEVRENVTLEFQGGLSTREGALADTEHYEQYR